MMIKITTYITLLIAICLSGVAAYFSVFGLMEIFSASPEAVMVMAIVLETAKVSTAYWAHVNWKILPGLIKTYLVIAVLILMGITSLGIYGFLAKAHITQKAEIVATYDSRIKSIQASIDNRKEALNEIDKQLQALDEAINTTAASSSRGYITKSYEINKKYLNDKQELIARKNPIQQDILKLEQDKIGIESEKVVSETKVGPLKYVANLVYGEATPAELNTAVRWLIIILITVFDPLAILLLIGTGYVLRYLENPIGRNPVPIARPAQSRQPINDEFEANFDESKFSNIEFSNTEPATFKSNKKIVVTKRKPS